MPIDEKKLLDEINELVIPADSQLAAFADYLQSKLEKPDSETTQE